MAPELQRHGIKLDIDDLKRRIETDPKLGRMREKLDTIIREDKEAVERLDGIIKDCQSRIAANKKRVGEIKVENQKIVREIWQAQRAARPRKGQKGALKSAMYCRVKALHQEAKIRALQKVQPQIFKVDLRQLCKSVKLPVNDQPYPKKNETAQDSGGDLQRKV